MNTVGRRGIWVRRADKLQSGVALETAWAKLLLYHWHVGPEVVIRVEKPRRSDWVEDGDLYVRHGG